MRSQIAWPLILPLHLLPLPLPAALAEPPPARLQPSVIGAQAPHPESGPDAAPAPSSYADSFIPLQGQVREFERDPSNRYTYCIRSTAVYECLSYARGGTVRRSHASATAHGTGFAYREVNGETLLLTNHHVVEWPEVTDTAHRAGDVPAGCKLLSTTRKIVDNEDDDFVADDVALALVIADAELDAAIVKSRTRLRLMPYRVGRSSALRAGDVVMVRGFPLGVFQAINTGKVINTHDLDQYKDWDHLDFIIDAPLASGNSGSPVFAINRQTGEYELVGLYHAGYTRATALNAVVGIDQLKDMMFSLRRPVRATGGRARLGPEDRAELDRAISRPGFIPHLQLGPLFVQLSGRPGGHLYQVFSRRFPLDDQRLLVLADRPATDGFGELASVWWGNERGLKAYDPSTLSPESRGQVAALLGRLQRLALDTVQHRALRARAISSRESLAARTALQRSMNRDAAGDADLAQLLIEQAERLSPGAADTPVPIEQVVSWQPPAAVPQR